MANLQVKKQQNVQAREAFVEEVGAEDLSVKELKAKIEERDRQLKEGERKIAEAEQRSELLMRSARGSDPQGGREVFQQGTGGRKEKPSLTRWGFCATLYVRGKWG